MSKRSYRRLYFTDAYLIGMEYNGIHPRWKLSKGMYRADIAKNPFVIASGRPHFSVLNEVSKVNMSRHIIDKDFRRVKGRQI